MSKICTCLSISPDPLCAFHGDVDKIAAIAAASVPSPPAQGTFACPICGVERVHAHGDDDVFAWLDAQASRFGYRMHEKQWGLRPVDGLANRVEHCIRRLTDPDSVSLSGILFSSTPIGRYTIETLREELPFVRERERIAVETFLQDAVPSPPAQPKEWECVCTHHYRAHDRFTGRCTEGGCECSGYVDGPATFALKPSPPVADSPTGPECGHKTPLSPWCATCYVFPWEKYWKAQRSAPSASAAGHPDKDTL